MNSDDEHNQRAVTELTRIIRDLVGDTKKPGAIHAAVAAIMLIVDELVHAAECRNSMTRLPNKQALGELLERHLHERRSFWAAFIEIDRFKSINDRVGHHKADELRRGVGRLLRELSRSLPGDVQLFHPYGDEFYFVGTFDASDRHQLGALAVLLDWVRTKVGNFSLPVVHGRNKEPERVSCTVSIGWMVTTDVVPPLTPSALLDHLELAVSHAKRGRNRVVPYSSNLQRNRWVSLRTECSTCSTKMALDIAIGEERKGPLTCGNCGNPIDRPPARIVPSDGVALGHVVSKHSTESYVPVRGGTSDIAISWDPEDEEQEVMELLECPVARIATGRRAR